MAYSREQLEQALFKAHEAGNEEHAKFIASQLSSLAVDTPSNVETPKEQSFVDTATEKVKAGLHGLQDALFLGADDEINAGIQWAAGKLGLGEDESFAEKHKQLSSAKKKLQAENPYAYGTGQGLSMFTGYGAAKALPEAAKAMSKHPVLVGAGTGGVSGYNDGDNLEDRLTGGATGVALGYGLSRLGASPEYMKEADKRLLARAHTKLSPEFDPKNVDDAVKIMNGVKDDLTADLSLLADRAKQAGLTATDQKRLSKLLSSAGKKHSVVGEADKDWVREKLGGSLGRQAVDLLDESNAYSSSFASNRDLLPDDFGGVVSEAANSRVGAGGLIHAGTKIPLIRHIDKKFLQPRNHLNQGLAGLGEETLDGLSSQLQKQREGLANDVQLRSGLGQDTAKTVSASQKGLKRLQEDRITSQLQQTVNSTKEMGGSVLDDANWSTIERSLVPHWKELQEAKGTGKGALGRLSKEIKSPKDFRDAMKTALNSGEAISYTDPKTGKLMSFVPDETDVQRAISNLKSSKMGDAGERAKAFYSYVADVAKKPKLTETASKAKARKAAKAAVKAQKKQKHHKSPVGGRLFRHQLNNGGLYGKEAK